MVNLKNAAEYGSTLPARPFPAMKVPPQKNAVSNEFYVGHWHRSPWFVLDAADYLCRHSGKSQEKALNTLSYGFAFQGVIIYKIMRTIEI